MSFLFLSAGQSLGLLGAGVLAVVAIYLLKPPPVPLHVASTRLWDKVIERRDNRKELWRYLFSLLLAVAIAALLALALAGLQPGGSDLDRPTFIVIDNSPSSAASTLSGETRLERSIAIARGLVAQSSGEVLVADTAGQLGGLHFGHKAQAERRLDRLSPQLSNRLHFPAGGLAAKDGKAPVVHFITDGVSALRPPEGTQLHSTFEPVTNVAITAFGARPGSLKRGALQAAIEVVNGSLTPQIPVLEIRAGGDLLVERPLKLEAGEAWSASIDLSGHADKKIDAKVSVAQDALASDNTATFQAVARSGSTRIAVRGSEARPALDLLLSSAPGFRVVQEQEAEVLVVLGGDLAKSRELSQDQDALPTLHLGPATYAGQPARRADSPAALSLFGAGAPELLYQTPWESLRPTLLSPPESFETADRYDSVLMSDEKPVLLSNKQRPRLVLAVRLDASTLAHTFFPEFFENAIAWLADEEASRAKQTNPSATEPADSEPHQRLADERLPFINRSNLAPASSRGSSQVADETSSPAGSLRLWRVLLAVAVFLLALQGVTAARRITV